MIRRARCGRYHYRNTCSKADNMGGDKILLPRSPHGSPQILNQRHIIAEMTRLSDTKSFSFVFLLAYYKTEEQRSLFNELPSGVLLRHETYHTMSLQWARAYHVIRLGGNVPWRTELFLVHRQQQNAHVISR